MQLLLLNSFINFLTSIPIFAHVHLVAYFATGNAHIFILSILIKSLFLLLSIIYLVVEIQAIVSMKANLNARFFMLFVFLFLADWQSWVRVHHLRGVEETSVIYLIVWLLAFISNNYVNTYNMIYLLILRSMNGHDSNWSQIYKKRMKTKINVILIWNKMKKSNITWLDQFLDIFVVEFKFLLFAKYW